MNPQKLIFSFLFLLFLTSTNASIIYVNSSASGDNNGLTWINAYTDLQSALQIAVAGDEIRVAAGTYKPTSGGDRTLSFNIPTGVVVMGGYNLNNPSAQRDWVSNPTILSGNIGNPLSVEGNSFSVVYMEDVDSTTVLDGFTIRDGYAKLDGEIGESVYRSGGGLYIYTHDSQVSPRIRNCTFIDNFANYYGAAVFVYSDGIGKSGVHFENCYFGQNDYEELSAIGFSIGITDDDIIFDNCRFANIETSNVGEYCIGYFNDSEENARLQIRNCVADSCNLNSQLFAFSAIGQTRVDELNIADCHFNTIGDEFCEFYNFKNVSLIDSYFTGENTASITFGVSWQEDDTSIQINNCAFIDNVTRLRVLSVGSFDNVEIANNQFIGNTVVGSSPVEQGDHLIMINSSHGNTENFIIENNLFYDNYFGIINFRDTSAETRILNNTIYSNESPYDLISCWKGENVTFQNNIIADNILDASKRILRSYGNPISLVDYNLFELDNCDAISSHADFECADNNIFDESPTFVDVDNLDFTLDFCSPGVNVGNNLPENSELDLYGNPRIMDDNIDMGAVETVSMELTDVEVKPTACSGIADGNVTVETEFSCEPLTYTWQMIGGETGEGNENLAAGDYMMTITDARGSYEVINFTIETGYFELIMDIQTTSNVGNEGQIEIQSVAGGLAPYTFEWSTGSTEEIISNLAAGDYGLTITDATGCTYSTTFTIEVISSLNNYLDSQYSIFPNPTSEILTISGLSNHAAVNLLNNTGQRLNVSSYQINNNVQLKVDQLPAGIYYLQILDMGDTIYSPVSIFR